jgi:hypothetical protein
MAKELGMTPKSLFKNIPSPSQEWYASVKVLIRDFPLLNWLQEPHFKSSRRSRNFVGGGLIASKSPIRSSNNQWGKEQSR